MKAQEAQSETLEDILGKEFSQKAKKDISIQGGDYSDGSTAFNDKGKTMLDFYFNRVNVGSYSPNIVSHMILKNNLGVTRTEEHYCIPEVKIKELLSDPTYIVSKFLSVYEDLTYQFTKIDEENNFYISLQASKSEDTFIIESSISTEKDFEQFKVDYELTGYSDYLKSNSKVFVNWYLGKDQRGEMIYKKVPLNCTRSVTDSFYPSICEKYDLTLMKFIEEFKNSEESILILSGIKGSGKTELIRQIANIFNTDVTLTFDKHIMMDNTFYSEFFTSTQSDLMVIEDADTLLSKRSDGNPIMDLFLNLSDGLISSPKKKFIFTSNLPNLSSIDEALLRKGRCFASIEFENLTVDQAKQICKDVEVEYDKVIETSNPRHLTLSSIMAVKNNTLGSQIKESSIDRSNSGPSFGFGITK